MAKRKRSSEVLNVRGGLLQSRLPHFINIRFEFSWSSKRNSVHCSVYGFSTPRHENYSLGSGYVVLTPDPHPNWCNCGRDISRLIQIAKLRAWMNANILINKNQIRSWGTGLPDSDRQRLNGN